MYYSSSSPPVLFLLVWIVLPSLVLVNKLCHAENDNLIYTDKWAVHIEGGEEVAQNLAVKHGFSYLRQIMPDYYLMQHRQVSKRSIYSSSHYHESLNQEENVKWLEQQVAKRRVKRDLTFNDPKYPRMWYLRRGRGLDMNVMSAWSKGFTGKHVVVSILDDGIEKDHPDLKKNYDGDASYDVNGHDRDPQPRYDYTNENRHGTRCAGEVAAEANNGICSVGVAYNASIGGVRMLDGDVTDAVEAESLSLNPNHIDIYSASWGPDDDGRTVDGPAILARKAFYDGITKGRRGKGSIFVWASGNGGRDGDSCNCDGYTNSIYTLSISSATENGHIPWYSEACSSTLASTYSSGSGGERQIVTTDLRKGCTETHTGTSASAPLAAGICALALQANPRMTWRDMQHIVVLTAWPANLRASDWVVNGMGRKVSHHFGFGLMDASGMVDLARNWTNVPQQHRCEIRSKSFASRHVDIRSRTRVTLDSNGCEYNLRQKVLYLEHVQALVTMTASRRGEVEIYLTSPMGTRSTLLQRRSRDHSMEGFNNWAFMTTHNWGETSKGRWTLEIVNGDTVSELKTWSLVLYGTATHPQRGRAPPPQNGGIGLPEKECPDEEFKLDNYCFKECPSNTFPTKQTVLYNGTWINSTADFTTSNASTSSPVTQDTYVLGICEHCNTVCLNCFGPGQNECLECTHGYHLKDHSCKVSLVITQPSGERGMSEEQKKLFKIVIIILAVSICIFTFVIGVIYLLYSKGFLCCKNKSNSGIPGASYSWKELGGQGQRLLDYQSDDDEDVQYDYREKENGNNIDNNQQDNGTVVINTRI